MKNQHLTMIFILLGAAMFVYSIFLAGNPSLDGDIVACTEEALICPDGSAVGRVGPDCEFAPCPTSESGTSNEKGLCLQNGGVYDDVYKECGGIDKAVCEEIGGIFNECASPCRHDQDAQQCILSCELVCEL